MRYFVRIRPVCHSFLLALAVLSVTVRAGEAAHLAGLPPGLAVQTGSTEVVYTSAWIKVAFSLQKMLEGYRDGTFQNGIGNGGDWKEWNGTPCGYEGLLVDAYYPLTALITGRLGRGVQIP